jgi:tRNA dimethylallyltransferase
MPHESYNAGDFEREARLKILEIFDRGKKPLIVGGTGFYLKALIYGLWEGAADPRIRGELEMISSATLFEELKDKDPLSAQRIGLNDRYRLLRSIELLRITGKTPTQLQSQKSLIPDPQFELLVLDQVDSELTQRISTRTDQMIARGLVEETQGLLQKYPDARALRSVGYLQCIRFLQGDLPPGRKVAAGISGLKDEINLATRQLVKAQRTWFKGQKSATHFNAHADALRVIERLEQVYAT